MKNEITTNPITQLKAMLDTKGEIDLTVMNFSERLQKFQDFEVKANANLILFSQHILSQMPEGTTLLPIPIFPKKQDAWRGADASKMQLKSGHVEPSAEFIIELGNLAGANLEKVFEGEVSVDGIIYFQVLYDACITLPSGVEIRVKGEGKSQQLYNYFTNNETGVVTKKIQAHTFESTRKKAKRNALKELFKIRTSMPEEEFDRPWVLLRPVYHAGVSEKTDRLISKNEKSSAKAVESLYGSHQVIEVKKEDGELNVSQITTALTTVETIEALEALGKEISEMRLTQTERDSLVITYKNQRTLLKGGV